MGPKDIQIYATPEGCSPTSLHLPPTIVVVQEQEQQEQQEEEEEQEEKVEEGVDHETAAQGNVCFCD